MTNDRPLNADATGAAVRALLFDLDGTLVDTESHTDSAVREVARRYGVGDFALPHTETRGRTWMHVAETIRAQTAIDAPAAELASAMLKYWSEAVIDVREIRGAKRFIRAAHAAGLKLAVVSSSPRSVINYFVDKLGVGDCIGANAFVGADSVTKGKPDPEGFLLAARILQESPATSLVFEDSHAGLLAARAAGMRSMFVTCCAADLPGNMALATGTCTDYDALPPHFSNDLAAGRIALRAVSAS